MRERIRGAGIRGVPFLFAWLGMLAVVLASHAARAASPLRSEMQRLSGEIPEVRRPHPDVLYDFDLNRESFYVLVPPNYDGKEPFGVLVFISASDTYTLPRAWIPVLMERKLVYIVPQNTGNNHPMPRRCGLAVVSALKMMEALKIDPTRVYISGFSGGGWVACRTAFFHSDLFRGVIPICGLNFYKPVEWTYTRKPLNYGYFDLEGPLGEEARTSVRFAPITGPGDHRYNPIRDVFLGGFQRGGFQAKLFDVPGMGHTMCSPEILEEALDFIENSAAQPKGPDETAKEANTLVRRNWTSISGMSMEAELLDVVGGMVRLRRDDGEIVQIEIERFTEADRAVIRQFLP